MQGTRIQLADIPMTTLRAGEALRTCSRPPRPPFPKNGAIPVTNDTEPRLDGAAKDAVLDRLLGTLANRVLDDASGANYPAGARLPAQPQKNIWLGMLASAAERAA